METRLFSNLQESTCQLLVFSGPLVEHMIHGISFVWFTFMEKKATAKVTETWSNFCMMSSSSGLFCWKTQVHWWLSREGIQGKAMSMEKGVGVPGQHTQGCREHPTHDCGRTISQNVWYPLIQKQDSRVISRAQNKMKPCSLLLKMVKNFNTEWSEHWI